MSVLSEKLIFKLKAFSIHLALSFFVFIVILYFILFEWYPEPFFTAQGGWQGIQLMAFVDLVLGPALTFIVYDHLKSRKAIVFDLSVIAVVQIVALVWGGHAVYSQRPIALVFWASAFYTVTSDDYTEQGINSPDFTHYSDHVPPLIYSLPALTRLELDMYEKLTNQKIPPYDNVDAYENIDSYLETIFANQVDIEKILTSNEEMNQSINKITKGEIESYKYLALKAKYQNMILIMRADGSLLGEVKAPPAKLR